MAFVTILIVMFWALPQQSLGNDGWVSKTNEEGVEVFTRSVAGSKIHQFRATTIVKASLDEVVEVILNYEEYPHWYKYCKSVRVLSRVGEESVVQLTMGHPLLIDDRDAINRVLVVEQSQSLVRIQMESDPDYVEPVDDVVRMTIAGGSWTLRAHDGGTAIEHIYHGDPEALWIIPSLLINTLLPDGPAETFKELKRLLE